MPKPFAVNVNALRSTPGTPQDVERCHTLADLFVSGSAVAGDQSVCFNGTLEAIDGTHVVANGRVNTTWTGACRRCLGAASGAIGVEVREIFEPEHTEGETYPIDGDSVDLELLVREAVMLELPEAPLCSADCKGICPTCGTNWNEGTCNCSTEVTDPRWAALDALLEEADPSKSGDKATE